MGISVIKLSKFLMSNSILDCDDKIQAITVDDKKELVMFDGSTPSKQESDAKIIHFSATFDEIDKPISIKRGRMKRITVLDEEVDDEKVRKPGPDDEKSEAKGTD